MAEIKSVKINLRINSNYKHEVKVPTFNYAIIPIGIVPYQFGIEILFKADKEGSTNRVAHLVPPGAKIPKGCDEKTFVGVVKTKLKVHPVAVYLVDERF